MTCLDSYLAPGRRRRRERRRRLRRERRRSRRRRGRGRGGSGPLPSAGRPHGNRSRPVRPHCGASSDRSGKQSRAALVADRPVVHPAETADHRVPPVLRGLSRTPVVGSKPGRSCVQSPSGPRWQPMMIWDFSSPKLHDHPRPSQQITAVALACIYLHSFSQEAKTMEQRPS